MSQQYNETSNLDESQPQEETLDVPDTSEHHEEYKGAEFPQTNGSHHTYSLSATKDNFYEPRKIQPST